MAKDNGKNRGTTDKKHEEEKRKASEEEIRAEWRAYKEHTRELASKSKEKK